MQTRKGGRKIQRSNGEGDSVMNRKTRTSFRVVKLTIAAQALVSFLIGKP